MSKADDLCRMVMGRFCRKCGEYFAPGGDWPAAYCPCNDAISETSPPISERCTMMPESLWWDGPGEDDEGGRYKGHWVLRHVETTPEIAAALIRDSVAQLMAEECGGASDDHVSWRVRLVGALSSPNPTKNLLTIMHCLRDHQENQP